MENPTKRYADLLNISALYTRWAIYLHLWDWPWICLYSWDPKCLYSNILSYRVYMHLIYPSVDSEATSGWICNLQKTETPRRVWIILLKQVMYWNSHSTEIGTITGRKYIGSLFIWNICRATYLGWPQDCLDRRKYGELR